jgi:hypothetical protein
MIAPPEDFHWISAQVFPRACYLFQLAPTCLNLAHMTMLFLAKVVHISAIFRHLLASSGLEYQSFDSCQQC